MKGRLTDKEKEELKRLLEDQDKPLDNSWLMADEYSKKTNKENPYNLKCVLCMKTHLPSKCPNKKEKVENTYKYSYYNHDSDGEGY